MFIDLIYKENKVFCKALKCSENIEILLSEIRQTEDLSTAILLLEGKGVTKALFILENKLYALYCLDAHNITPLLFSDLFKDIREYEAQVTLYQISPVLFKCLLIVAQCSPSGVAQPEVVDLEYVLEQIKKQNQEALLVFKEDETIQLFYFLNGDLRDAYHEKQAKKDPLCKLKEEMLEASNLNKTLCIELFDKTDISAANDCDTAEQALLKHHSPSVPAQDRPAPSASQKSEESPLWVKVLDGSRAGFLIRFSQEPVSLGRGNVSVRLNDPQVSRFHAELAWEKDRLFIRDNHSTNGIFINDEKTERRTLRLHDIIRLGDVRLKVVAES